MVSLICVKIKLLAFLQSIQPTDEIKNLMSESHPVFYKALHYQFSIAVKIVTLEQHFKVN